MGQWGAYTCPNSQRSQTVVLVCITCASGLKGLAGRVGSSCMREEHLCREAGCGL